MDRFADPSGKNCQGRRSRKASAIGSGVRKRDVVRARKLFSQIALRKKGYSGADVARFLGMTTSAVNRMVSQEEMPESEHYGK